MGYSGFLKQGTRRLELDDSGRHEFAAEFLPPSTRETPSISRGTSQNRFGGGELIGKRAENRIYMLPVHVTGASNAEVERGIQEVEWMMSRAGDEHRPLTLYWRPHQLYDFEPFWGQADAYMRTEIVAVHSRTKSGIYRIADTRNKGATVRYEVEIKPYAKGKRQRLLTAGGCVIEDVYGSIDGRSRGVVMIEDETGKNKMTNPIFGHSTYNNGWTAGGSLTVSENKDEEYIVEGDTSAFLENLDNASASRVFYQSINVSNTNDHVLSFYAKRPDGGVINNDVLRVYYGSNQTTTFESVGNGWYLCYATGITGVAAGTNTGVTVFLGYSIYVDSFQMDETNRTWVQHHVHGDMLGCSWSGTAHSSSTDVDDPGRLKLDAEGEIFNSTHGTIRVAVKYPFPSTGPSGDTVYFATDTAPLFRAYYEGSTDKIKLTDGTNTAASSALSFSRNDVHILHFTWSEANGLAIYINGSADGTNGTYTAQADGTSFRVGHQGGTNQGAVTIMGFTTFANEMTSDEVSDDYANAVKITDDDQRLDWLPYLWTKDYDNVIDLYDDSTHDNFGVIHGIAGAAPADTTWGLSVTAVSDTELTAAINPYHKLIDMTNYFKDQGGTADASALGGEVYQNSIGTSWAVTNDTDLDYVIEEVGDKNIYLIMSLADAGSNLSLAIRLMVGYEFYDFDEHPVSADSTLRTFIIGPARISQYYYKYEDVQSGWLSQNSLAGRCRVLAKRDSGSANVDLDWYAMLVGKVAYIAGGGANTADWYIRGKIVQSFAASGGNIAEFGKLRGDVLDLEPELYNHVVFMFDDDEGATRLTNTTTVDRVYVQPRWGIA